MRRISVFGPLLLPLLVLSGIWARGLYVDRVFGRITTCHDCYFWLVVKHDLVFLATTIALVSISLAFRRPLLRLIFLALAGTCAFIYLLDVMVLLEFGTRLRLFDVLRFGTQFDAVGNYLVQSLPTVKGVAALLTILLIPFGVFVSVLVSPALSGQRTGVVLSVCFIAAIFSFVPDGSTYVHAWSYRNLVELSQTHGRDQDYSESFKSEVLADETAPKDHELCSSGLGIRRNVIVVLFESLSAYHSKRYSGLNDWTPNLDAIGARHREWPKMIANGFTTDHGLIAVIGGQDPIPSVDYYENLDETWGFPDLGNSLPNRFEKHDYHTAFLTTGNLGFIDKGQWLAESGFDEIEGHEHPSYEGQPRLHFKAAPDEALYRRARQWMADNETKEPWLLVLQTVSSHQPFIEPYTRERSEEAAIKYADQALGDFYESLREKDMLNDHVLVVASDHRAMTPVTADQYERFGPAARSIVPMVAAGLPETEQDDRRRLVQQTEIGPSLEWLVADRACFDEREANLFTPGPGTEERCVLHYRGDMRDRIDAFCGDRHGVIELNGDDTGVVSGEVPRAQSLIAEINRERIQRRARQD